MPAAREESLHLFEEYERNKTPEDIRIEGLEDDNDERYLEEPDMNETDLPIAELWKAWGLEDRGSSKGNPRNRKTA